MLIRFKTDRYIAKRVWVICYADARSLFRREFHSLRPLYPYRLVLLLVMNAVNWGLAAQGVSAASQPVITLDFATHLLTVFIANVMLYTSFYIVMKLRHGERLGLQPTLYLIFSMVSRALYVTPVLGWWCLRCSIWSLYKPPVL